jgi:hypothetical protein
MTLDAFPSLALLQVSTGRPIDRGLVLVLLGLMLASILAHRYWRAKIRLEDELASTKKDLTFYLGRYRQAFRSLNLPAALLDRASGLIVEGTPGWRAAGLPANGEKLDAGAMAALNTLPTASEVRSLDPFPFSHAGQALTAEPLLEEGLGLILIQVVK